MAKIGNSKYEWNYNTLKRVYFQLKFKARNEDEEKEYLLLESILSGSTSIDGISFVDSISFSDEFKIEAQTLLYDYYDYLLPIFDFYDNSDDSLKKMTYEQLPMTEDDLLDTAHDFFKSLDPEWYQLFMNLYRQRKTTVSFTDCRSFSSYFPSNGLWLANITRKHTIQDYVNTIHEFAHGIADQLTDTIKTYNADNIFIELFPIVIQMVWLYEFNDLGLQHEISKYMNNYLKIMIAYAEEIRMKYNIASTFVNVKNSRNLSRLIKKEWGITISKEELEEIYSNPVEELFSYVFPFLIAIELMEIYTKDKAEFITIMNDIIKTDLKPLELLDKYNLTPNKSLK